MTNVDALSSRYELGFGIFVTVLAFLGKDNPSLVYPEILYLFLALMCLNLSAGVALRARPATPGMSAVFLLANCAVITAMLAYSGGARSNLWVLFLLPIFTVCLLMGGREAAGLTAAVAGINAAFTFRNPQERAAVIAFEALLKSGFFGFTALLAWRLAAKEREMRRRLQAEQARAGQLATRLEATSALSEVGLVGAGVAHDLRNTFTVISGYAEAIEEQGTLPAYAQEGFKRIQQMAQLGGQISRQLARHGATAPIKLKPDDLGTLAQDVARLLTTSFREKEVELLVDVGSEPCPITASRVHLQRVLFNLLLNALSVSPAGGVVRLAVRSEARWAIAEVEDCGPGFPKEALARLFQAYETTRGDAGTGLGLNLCARIAKEHQGELAAENRSVGGALLRLRLPLAIG